MTDKEYIKNISSISTEKLFNSLEYYGYDSYYADLVEATIEELKKRFEEKLQGEWIVDEDAFSKDFRKCSNCNEDAEWLEGGCQFLPNFCPNCGADMRGGRE